MMTPYEVVKEHIHERMIWVKLAVQLTEEAIEKGNFEEAVKWADNIRDNLKFSGFERQVFSAVQAASNRINTDAKSAE